MSIGGGWREEWGDGMDGMTDGLAGGTNEGREQLADRAAYWIGCIDMRMRMGRMGWRDGPIAMIMVAVVRPLRSNHFSEYMGPRTWKMGCAIPENIFGMKRMRGIEVK